MSDPTTPAGWGIQLSKLWIQCGQPFPVNVREIALEVTRARFQDPVGIIRPHGVAGIDGMLSKRKNKQDWCISYDEAVTIPGRINFTLGHELGHYLLHRQTRDSFACGQLDVLDYSDDAAKRQECEANRFASYLLMPADDFRAQINGQSVTLDLLAHCASRYETSLTATALKWLEITDDAAMLVVARDGFVCWSYPSRLASKVRSYLSPGTPVPDSRNCEAEVLGLDAKAKPFQLPAGVWHPSLDSEEFVIVSDRFDMVIFLVRFPNACAPDPADEKESDAATFLTERAKGLHWSR